MKDVYKIALEEVVNDLDNNPAKPMQKATVLLEFIHALLKLYLVMVNENTMILFVQLRHIDDSIIKARYN